MLEKKGTLIIKMCRENQFIHLPELSFALGSMYMCLCSLCSYDLNIYGLLICLFFFFQIVADCLKRANPPRNTAEVLLGGSANRDRWLFCQIICQAWFGLSHA